MADCEGDDSEPLIRRRKAPEPPSTRIQAFFHNVWEKMKPTLKAINQFLTVPMWAALISIFIAMIPPLQAFLGRMEPFEKAIKGAGQCSSEMKSCSFEAKLTAQSPSP